jgi:hypothetical protein
MHLSFIIILTLVHFSVAQSCSERDLCADMRQMERDVARLEGRMRRLDRLDHIPFQRCDMEEVCRRMPILERRMDRVERELGSREEGMRRGGMGRCNMWHMCSKMDELKRRVRQAERRVYRRRA